MNSIAVVDIGSDTVRAGFASEFSPRIIFPTQQISENKDQEQLWTWIFQELKKPSQECALIITEPPFDSLTKQADLIQLCFEKFQVPSILFAKSGVLSLYAAGRTIGIVLDSGFSSSRAIPVIDRSVMISSVMQSQVGGMNIDEKLKELLYEKRISIEPKQARKIKEKFCFVDVDGKNEFQINTTNSNNNNNTFELPDKQVISLGDERLKAPEILFQSKSDIPLHKLIISSLLKTNTKYHHDLWSNIVLSGGTTLLPGLGLRLEKELKACAPSNVKVQVIAPPNRQFSAWIGGSILGSRGTLTPITITKAQYQEKGLLMYLQSIK